MAATEEDRLSTLPHSVRLLILSLLPTLDEIARTSILSKRWRFLWNSVPVSLRFPTDGIYFSTDGIDILKYNKVLLNSKSFKKIQKFSVDFLYFERYKQDVDYWVYYATKSAMVEDFTLRIYTLVDEYMLPSFAYKNSSLKDLVLSNCQLNPSASVNWSSLVSLSIGLLKLTDGVMENVLSGCPNLECLEMKDFSGLYRLEISSLKLRKLIISNCRKETDRNAQWLEIFAPNVQDLQLLVESHEMWLRLRNVASLVTVVLNFEPRFVFDDDAFGDCFVFDDDADGDRFVFDDDADGDGENDNLDNEYRYLQELLACLAHVKNLELGPQCIESLSMLELSGWQSPASSRKSLTLNSALVQEDFPAICNLLQSSSDIETLVIDWKDSISRYPPWRFIGKDENDRRFEKHVYNSSLLHLRTIKIINYCGPLSVHQFILPLVKHLLKNAKVLEKMVIAANLCYNKIQGSDLSRDFVEMAQELLSFPRSSESAVMSFLIDKPRLLSYVLIAAYLTIVILCPKSIRNRFVADC